MKNFITYLFICCLFFSFFITPSEAIIKIDITQGNSQKIPIAYKNCTIGNKYIVKDIINIINNDLSNTGMFELIENDSVSNCDKTIELISTSLINHESSILYTISLKKADRNNVEVSIDAYDVITRDHIINKTILSDIVNYRKIAHSISDLLYKKLTGENGYFSTKISYVAEIPNRRRNHPNNRKIAIMDYDGHNVEFITEGNNTVGSPSLSLNQKKLIYISFDDKFYSKIYLYNIKNGKKNIISNFIGGVSYAPRFSPDGKKIIVSRTNGPVTDLFLLNLNNSLAKKLTMKSSINTSASYFQNGKKMAFISDRGGAPQIYVMDSDGNNQKRITFSGGSYFSPICSPKGDLIAFVKVYNRKSYIGVINTDGTGERLITSGGVLGSPTWSPNSRSIVFTRKDIKNNKKYDKSKIYIIDVNGRGEREIVTKYEAKEVSWS